MQETYQRGPNPLSQLLIAIGIVLINIYIFNMFSQWIGLKLFDADVAVLLQNGLFNELTTNEINAIRFSQFFTSFGGFIMSSFVIMQVFQQNPWEYMRLNKVPSTKFVLLGLSSSLLSNHQAACRLFGSMLHHLHPGWRFA